jgi:hypothetical protein
VNQAALDVACSSGARPRREGGSMNEVKEKILLHLETAEVALRFNLKSQEVGPAARSHMETALFLVRKAYLAVIDGHRCHIEIESSLSIISSPSGSNCPGPSIRLDVNSM